MSKSIEPEGAAFQKALDELFANGELSVVAAYAPKEIFEAGWDAAVEWMKQKQEKEDE